MLTFNHKPRAQQSGFGLIEMMVAIVIGLIVIGGITSMVVATLRTNTDQVRMTRLTQDLRSSMALITRELRRAGYDQDAVFDFGRGSHSANDFIDVQLFDGGGNELDVENGITAATPATCVIYGWDADGDGAMDSGEYRGFRLDTTNDALDAKTSGAKSDADCEAGTWASLTDPDFVEIGTFAITTVNGNPAPQVTNTAGNTILTVRELVVNLEGSVVGDATLTREMKETVRVRNDLFK